MQEQKDLSSSSKKGTIRLLDRKRHCILSDHSYFHSSDKTSTIHGIVGIRGCVSFLYAIADGGKGKVQAGSALIRYMGDMGTRPCMGHLTHFGIEAEIIIGSNCLSVLPTEPKESHAGMRPHNKSRVDTNDFANPPPSVLLLSSPI